MAWNYSRHLVTFCLETRNISFFDLLVLDKIIFYKTTTFKTFIKQHEDPSFINIFSDIMGSLNVP